MPTLEEIMAQQAAPQNAPGGQTLEQILATAQPVANPMRSAAESIQSAATTPLATGDVARFNAETGMLPAVGAAAGTLLGGPAGLAIGAGVGQAGKEAFREEFGLPPDTSLSGMALERLSGGKLKTSDSRIASVLGTTLDNMVLDKAFRTVGWASAKISNLMSRRVANALEHPDTKEFIATMAKLGEQPTLGEIENIGFLRSLQDLAEKGGKEVAVERNKRLFGKFMKAASDTMDSIAPQQFAGERGLQIRQTVEQAFENFKQQVGKETIGALGDKATKAGVKVDIGKAVFDDLANLVNEGKGIKMMSPTAQAESQNEAVKIMAELKQNAPLAASIFEGKTGPVKLTAEEFRKLTAGAGKLEIPWNEAQYLKSLMGRLTAKSNPGLARSADVFYGPLADAQRAAAEANGFGKAWDAARQDYKDGMELFDKRLLPALLAKDPERLITALGRDSGAQWDRLKQGLLQYGKADGEAAWRTAQRQWMESLFMDPVKGKSFSNMTQMADEIASYSPEVKKALVTKLDGTVDPVAKAAFDNMEKLANAAQRFRYLNPKGAKEGLYNLNAEMMGQAQVAMGAGANVVSGRSLGLGTVVNGVAKLGPTWVATHILMDPKASGKLLTAIELMAKAGSNPALTQQVHSEIGQAVRLALTSQAVKEAYAAGAEDMGQDAGRHPKIATPSPK